MSATPLTWRGALKRISSSLAWWERMYAARARVSPGGGVAIFPEKNENGLRGSAAQAILVLFRKKGEPPSRTIFRPLVKEGQVVDKFARSFIFLNGLLLA